MEEPGCEYGNGNEPGSVLFYFLFIIYLFHFLFFFCFLLREPAKPLFKAEFWPATVVCSVWEASSASTSLDETLSDM